MKKTATSTRPPPQPEKGEPRADLTLSNPALLATLDFLQELPWFPDARTVLDALGRLLVRQYKLSWCRIAIKEETGGRYLFWSAHPAMKRRPPALQQTSPLIEYLERARPDLLVRSGKSVLNGPPELLRAQTALTRLGASLCFPLFSTEGLLGLVMLGAPRPTRCLSQQELAWVKLAVQNVSLVIDRVFLADELALIGRISRGMAHDLQSLLTPVSLFLQLWQEGTPPRAKLDTLLPVASRNLKAMQTFIRQTLLFSKRQQPNFRPQDLGILLRKAAELGESEANRKDILLSVRLQGNLVAQVDEFLILRLLGNLISNAIRVSPAGSSVRLHAAACRDRKSKSPMLRIRVIDSGAGLSKSEWERLSIQSGRDGKLTADRESGHGLGLAICRKIVRLHQGHLGLGPRSENGNAIEAIFPACSNPVGPSPIK